MKIFISWSGKKSEEFASLIKEFLRGLFNRSIEIFISGDMPFGTMPVVSINKALYECEKCIICVTKENYMAPWIMYEVGAISERNKNDMTKDTIFPILFDDFRGEIFRRHPFEQFQMVNYEKEQIKKLVRQINEQTKCFDNIELLDKQFKLNWKSLNENVEKISKKYQTFDLACKELLNEFELYNFPKPDTGNISKFSNGFETQRLYEILLKHADKRLWVFGRKNRKLFANDNRFFFADLKRKISNGFDFKCLFLDSQSVEFTNKAQRDSNFKNNLDNCIMNAVNVLKQNGIKSNEVCRKYAILRTHSILIIDNVVLYSLINFDEDGYPLPLTDAPFCITNVESDYGKVYESNFNSTWHKAQELILP